MESFVQCATILSPIVAVLIAVVAGYLNSKDTAKHIAALEGSTTKQVESIKELAQIQLEITSLQINKELWDVRYRIIRNSQKTMDELDDDDKALELGINKEVYHNIASKYREANYENDFLNKQMNILENIQTQIRSMRKEIGGLNNG